MRTITLTVLLLLAAPASAGVYGRLGGGIIDPPTPSDCDIQRPTVQEIPHWSRLSWSLGIGLATSPQDGPHWRTTGALVPQLSYQLWARERQCASGSGLFSDDAWRRVSLGISIDAVYRFGGEATPQTDTMGRVIGSAPLPFDMRPGVRLSRSTFSHDLLSVGTPWVPTFDMSVTLGPTFDPGFSGGALSFNARFTIFTIEVRAAAYTERGQELMFLVGLTDPHGLKKAGPDRETAPYPSATSPAQTPTQTRDYVKKKVRDWINR